jgi:hypothetical protein
MKKMKEVEIKEWNIEMEDAVNSLKYYNPKGHNVLDLGCGRWGVTDPNSFTPIFAMNRGAKSVIGVDIDVREEVFFTQWFKDNNPDFPTKFYTNKINEPNQVRALIKEHDITFIKSDIEEYEIYAFSSFTKEDLKNVDVFVMEYHTLAIKELFIQKFKEWGYTITAHGNTYPHMVSTPKIGVLFGEKLN